MLRREFCAAAAAALSGSAMASPANGLKVATFKYDVTPPLGHPLCGGWIKPAGAVDLPLEARGIVILGADKPIVLCAVAILGASRALQTRLVRT